MVRGCRAVLIRNGSFGSGGALVTSAAGTFAYSVTATSKEWAELDGDDPLHGFWGSPSAAISSPA